MSLRSLILSSVFAFMIAVVLLNAWHLNKLTEQVSKRLGESAFSVSQATVESMLAQDYSQKLILDNKQLPSGLNQIIQLVSFHKTSTLQEAVELKLKDQENSRSITLLKDEHSFEIPIPRTKVEHLLGEVKQEVVVSSLGTLMVSLIFFYFLTQQLVRPLNKISETSTKIGAGNFGIQVDDKNNAPGIEFRRLIAAVNSMSTHLKTLEEEKQQLQEQKTTHEVAEIARGLAHSIRNPLHTIALTLDVRLESLNDFDSLKEKIKKQIQRIDAHLKNLMVITTHESLNAEKIDLKELIGRQLIEAKQQAPQLTINFEHGDNSQYLLNGLSSELESVFSALVGNAVEASLQDEGKIEVSLAEKDAVFTIQIVDEGKGIDDVIKKRLFEPHNTNKPYGAGMGIYLSNRIIKGRYQGSISITDNSPKGTIVTLELKNRTTTEKVYS